MEKYKPVYYEKNKININKQNKEYYEKNKIKITCECGRVVNKHSLNLHTKSLFHTNYLNTKIFEIFTAFDVYFLLNDKHKYVSSKKECSYTISYSSSN